MSLSNESIVRYRQMIFDADPPAAAAIAATDSSSSSAAAADPSHAAAATITTTSTTVHETTEEEVVAPPPPPSESDRSSVSLRPELDPGTPPRTHSMLTDPDPPVLAFHPALHSLTSSHAPNYTVDEEDLRELQQLQAMGAGAGAGLYPGMRPSWAPQPAHHGAAGYMGGMAEGGSATPGAGYGVGYGAGGSLARHSRASRTMSMFVLDDKMRATAQANNAAGNGTLVTPGIMFVPAAEAPQQEKLYDFYASLRRHRRRVRLYALILFVLLVVVVALSLSNNLRMIWLGGLNGGTGLLGGGPDVGFPGMPIDGIGDATYYAPAGQIGACGWRAANTQFVAALNAPQFGTFAQPANSPMCGACLKVTGPSGKTVKVRVVDRCEFCRKGDVDLSPVAFEVVALDISDGRVPITWSGC